MHLKILAVGRLKEKYWLDAQNEYLKRLAPYAKVKIVEVADEKVPEGAPAAAQEIIKTREGERLLKNIQPGAYIIALDREGICLSSESFAKSMAELGLKGKSEVYFIIGGSLGLSKEILNAAHLRLSFSEMTFPHQLMRVILLEQVYRAFKIIRGEPYHK